MKGSAWGCGSLEKQQRHKRNNALANIMIFGSLFTTIISSSAAELDTL